MPVTRNLRILNTHNTSTECPLLPCTYEGCGRQFKSKSALTKHNWTSHFPDAGPSGSHSSAPPDEPSEDQYFCTVPGCLYSFKTKLALTQHSRKQHSNSSNCPAPVTALHHPSVPGPNHFMNHQHHCILVAPGCHSSFQMTNLNPLTIVWPVIDWTWITNLTWTLHTMMTTTISYHWDQMSHILMACIHHLIVQAQPVTVPLQLTPIRPQLMMAHQTLLNGHITLQSMVC